MLVSTIFVNNLYAEGGNQVWLTKTKRGIDISCPYGFQYEDGNVQSCTKVKEAAFNAVLSYNDLYVEEEFFNEKDILKQAIVAIKLLPDVKIVEKKTSSWFGKITADIRYEKDDLKGLQRMIVFNDGTVITMQYLSRYNGYDVADNTLSSNIKILEPNQVAELEKIQEDYTKQAQDVANKKTAEELKKKLEQEQKVAEAKKKANEKKKADEQKKKDEDLRKKLEKQKVDAENQAKRIEKNIVVYGEQIKDFENRINAIQTNPISSKVMKQTYSLEDDLTTLKSKYAKFKTEKIASLEGEIRNLKDALMVQLTALEKKQSGNDTVIPQVNVATVMSSLEYSISKIVQYNDPCFTLGDQKNQVCDSDKPRPEIEPKYRTDVKVCAGTEILKNVEFKVSSDTFNKLIKITVIKNNQCQNYTYEIKTTSPSTIKVQSNTINKILMIKP